MNIKLHRYSRELHNLTFHGTPWISMDFHGIPWISMEFHGGISHREQRKWSLGLGHNALGLTCVRSQCSREINNTTLSEFSTFLKINKSREQFLLQLTIFYPIYGYRLNFWPFYANRLTPLRPPYEQLVGKNSSAEREWGLFFCTSPAIPYTAL